MSEELLTSIERFETLLRTNRRYQPEAYNFVYEALDWTLHHLIEGPAEPARHVAGKQLLEGIRQFAIEKFGLLTPTVFASWGVTRTDDWGEIVFNLIEYDLMGKQESDQKADFCGVYDFNAVFNLDLELEYDEKDSRWNVVYRPIRKRHARTRL
jgi:uncharacterized repeat protein (TIGR04138 family)